MIIDAHAHIVGGGSPAAGYLSQRGFHGRTEIRVSDAQIQAVTGPHIESLKAVGTDVQLISPRPIGLIHSAEPAKINLWNTQQINDLIARHVALNPEHYIGVCSLPQSPSTSPGSWVDEMERCIREYNFVGCILNPDPTDGLASLPSLEDEYWFPVYERLCELDVPALVHAAGYNYHRESFHNHFITEEGIAVTNLMRSDVFDRFPTLKLIISHGGGSVPYQMGRWRALNRSFGEEKGVSADEMLRKMYFDAALYSQEAIDLLMKVCGPDRVLFGTERPGAGNAIDSDGRSYDDVKPLIDNVSWMTDADRKAVYEDNARSLYKLKV